MEITITPAFAKLLKYITTQENNWTFDNLKERFEYHGVTEYRSVRYEIRNCLTFGLNQAAISLTNLYLEKFLKTVLIDSERKTNMADIEVHSAEIEQLVIKFGSRDLNLNIDATKRKGLITKDESQQLYLFKDCYRNPFSHYDIKGIYGENTMDLRVGAVDHSIGIQESLLRSIQDTTSEKKSMNVAHLIPMQDTWLENFANQTAFAYFVWIDNLVCRTELKKYPEMRGYQSNTTIDFDGLFAE